MPGSRAAGGQGRSQASSCPCGAAGDALPWEPLGQGPRRACSPLPPFPVASSRMCGRPRGLPGSACAGGRERCGPFGGPGAAGGSGPLPSRSPHGPRCCRPCVGCLRALSGAQRWQGTGRTPPASPSAGGEAPGWGRPARPRRSPRHGTRVPSAVRAGAEHSGG